MTASASAASAAKIAVIRTYFERLTASDMAGVLALFAPGATVTLPYLGTLPATAFFASLPADRVRRAAGGNRYQRCGTLRV